MLCVSYATKLKKKNTISDKMEFRVHKRVQTLYMYLRIGHTHTHTHTHTDRQTHARTARWRNETSIGWSFVDVSRTRSRDLKEQTKDTKKDERKKKKRKIWKHVTLNFELRSRTRKLRRVHIRSHRYLCVILYLDVRRCEAIFSCMQRPIIIVIVKSCRTARKI